MDERKRKERRVCEGKGGELGSPVGLVCVDRLSIRFQETHSVASAEAPSPALSPHFSHHRPPWQPPA